MADNSITFKTDLDNKQLEKELSSLAKQIEKIEDRIQKNTAKKSGIEKQMEQVMSSYRQAVAAGQDDLAKSLAGQWDGLNKQNDRLTQKLQEDTAELGRAKDRAGELTQELTAASRQGGALGDAVGAAEKRMDKFMRRIQGLAKRVFVFSLITTALRSMRSWFGEMIKTNSDATASIARLKGALLTLAQPLVQVVIPAFISLVNILTRVVTVVAQLVATLFGTTLKSASDSAKAMYDEKKAISGVGSAAKKAAGQLAAFDEINQLSNNSSSGGSDSTIAPDFDLGEELDPERLSNLLHFIEAIGAALAAWKIGSDLGLSLGRILALFVAIYEAIQFAKDIFDMWTNGVSWDNLRDALIHLALATAAFWVALGPLAAGIALIVGGLALLAAGFHDAAKNGWSFENEAATIAGLLATGLGIAILTGTWIPLLIAGIATLLLELAIATGHGEELIKGIQKVLQGFKDFFVGIFTGDIELAIKGIGEIFDGLSDTFDTVCDSIRDTILSFLDWLDEKTDGKFHDIIEKAKKYVTDSGETIKKKVREINDFIKQYLGDFIEFVSGVFTNDWDKAWKALVNIVVSVLNLVIQRLENFLNVLPNFINGILKRVNSVIDGLNSIPGTNIQRITFQVPTVTLPRIPRLAEGAVIPPNREFLAVLGDQHSGNNIEAPEALLRQMAQEAAGINTALLREILQAIREGKIIMVDKQVLGKTARSAMRGLSISGY